MNIKIVLFTGWSTSYSSSFLFSGYFVVLVLVMNFVIGGGVYMVYDAEIGCVVGVVERK